MPTSNERRAKISRCSTSNPCLLFYLSIFVYSINILDVELAFFSAKYDIQMGPNIGKGSMAAGAMGGQAHVNTF